VLISLLDKAAKFTPESGLIRVAVSVAGRSLEILIRDTRTSIPENRTADLSLPFSRNKNVLSSRHHGNGVGLFIPRLWSGGTVGPWGSRVVREREQPSVSGCRSHRPLRHHSVVGQCRRLGSLGCVNASEELVRRKGCRPRSALDLDPDKRQFFVSRSTTSKTLRGTSAS
jgi:hypothetical protein